MNRKKDAGSGRLGANGSALLSADNGGVLGGWLNPIKAFRRLPPYWRDSLTAYWYLLPAFAILAVFTFYPFFSAFRLSLFRWDLLDPPGKYIGFANYRYVFRDKAFWNALWNTFTYVGVTVPITIFLALLVASLLNKGLRFLSFARTSYFLAYISPLVAVSMVWRWMYNADYGLLNYLLSLIGKLPFIHINPVEWLRDPRYALTAVIIMSVWRFVGYDAIILLAGMQGIEKQYYDAAKVDGASGFQTWRKVTVPLLTPQIFFILVMSLIGSFKVFTEVYVLHSGTSGLLKSADTLVFYILRMSGRVGGGSMRLGLAAAASVILFAIIFAFTVFQMTVTQKRVHY